MVLTPSPSGEGYNEVEVENGWRSSAEVLKPKLEPHPSPFGDTLSDREGMGLSLWT
jgi:hypothetical protein